MFRAYSPVGAWSPWTTVSTHESGNRLAIDQPISDEKKGRVGYLVDRMQLQEFVFDRSQDLTVEPVAKRSERKRSIPENFHKIGSVWFCNRVGLFRIGVGRLVEIL
jgi:hypothetical protein